MKENLFKEGDIVKVVKKVHIIGIGWTPEMDKTIGKLFIVKEMNSYQEHNYYRVKGNEYAYPEESLELHAIPKFSIGDKVIIKDKITKNPEVTKGTISKISIDTAQFEHVYIIDDYSFWVQESKLSFDDTEVSLTLSIEDYYQIIHIPTEVYEKILSGAKIQLK
jgi:hypothetical protein